MDIELRVPKSEARDRIARQVKEGEHILRASPPTAERLSVLMRERGSWSEANHQVLFALFTTGDIANQHVALTENTWLRPPSLEEEIIFWMGSVRHEIAQLHAVLQGLQQYRYGAEGGALRHELPDASSPGTDVLVVHGDGADAGSHVASYLLTLGLNVSVLERQEQGIEIMGRLEDATVGFVVVLLTGAPTEGSPTPADAPAEPSRESVFCLGYALGRLGENRVCAVRFGDVAEPSGMPGLRCVLVDSDDGWKFLLAKELRAAGFEITVRAARTPSQE